jgi:hypothetical protein
MGLANLVGKPMRPVIITAPHQTTHSNVMYITYK